MGTFDDEVDRELAFTARLSDWQLAVVASAYELVVTALERVSAAYGEVTVGNDL